MDIFFTPSPNFKEGKNKPKFLVIHYTAGGSLDGAIDQFRRPNSVSCHYIIGKNGEPVQMVKHDDVAYHAGKSTWSGYEAHRSLNPFSIGIELVNWGRLEKDHAGIVRNWTGNKHNGLYLHRNNAYWDYYPFKQMYTLIEVIKHIESDTGPLKIVRHSDISPGRKIDPGPAFDLNRVLLELNHA